MRQARLDELLPIYDYKDNDGKTASFRPFGEIISYEFIWFHIKTQKGIIPIPKLCTDLDPYTDEYIADDCPFRKSGLGRSDRIYLVNAIDRKKEKLRPAKLPPFRASEKKLRTIETIFKDAMYYMEPNSDSWTPVVPLKLSASSVRQITAAEADNIIDGKSYGCTDLDYGFDLKIKFDSKGTGTGKMQITMGAESEITDAELDYRVYDLAVLKYPSIKAQMEEWKNFKDKITDAPDSAKKGGAAASRRLEEDEEEDDIRSSRASKGNTGKLKRRVEEDDEDEVPY